MRSYEEKKAETERLLALLPDVRDRLIGIPGVTKVAVGVRERGGELTDEFVFRVHVEQKLPADEVPPEHMVPAEVAGVPTDVVVRRRPVPEIGFGDEDDWTSYSPKVGGSRLGAEVAGGTGTLGCFCERTTDGKVVFLSNWHVLIDPGGANGDGVGHPKWRKSCCCTTGKIGEVVDFDEDLDCAIGLLDSGVTYAPKIRRIKRADGTTELEGRIEGSAAPVADDEVWKVGARTGLTRGTITDIDPQEIEVTPLAEFPRMSNKGDSGSVYVSLASGNVCGLHRAGDGTLGFGVPFDEVKAKLKIEVLTTGTGDYSVVDHEGRPSTVLAPYDGIVERLRASAAGRELLGLVERHREECLDLVERNRRCTIAWHRARGPEYLAALARSAGDPDYRIPERFGDLDRAAAVRLVVTALRTYASPDLLAALDEHEPVLGAAVAGNDTITELLRTWEESRQPVG